MNLPEENDRPLQINIVPMIDVIFAILTFFIFSSLFLVRNEGIPVNLPQAATTQMQGQAEITITIDRQGKIAVNQEFIALEQLEIKLGKLILPQQQITVIVNADTAVNHGKVVAVMDKLRSIPGVRIAIATKKI